MGGSAALGASLAGTDGGTAPPRTIELPSIEPTADDYVGFCTVTAQQFQDFLSLIERPDLLDDKGLASFQDRFARRDEFLAIVWEWTEKRKTADIEELAELLRIPVAPIGRPETITSLTQFVDRGVYVPNPGGFVQPRPSYRVDGEPHGDISAAPGLGEHTGSVTWPARPRRTEVPVSAPQENVLPLSGLRVIDLTAFWAGPVATLVLGSLGAEVIKVESVQRPDGMRFTSAKTAADPFWWEWGSVYQGNNLNKLDVTLDLRRPEGKAILMQLLGQADALIENYSPRVLDHFGITWDSIREVNPRLVMVRMPAFGLTGPWRDRTGFAQTMEQASGMAWMTGFADGAPVIPRGPCDPLAGMHATFALLASLEERRRSGNGHFVESTMVESALNVAAEMAIEYSAYGVSLMRDGNHGPVSTPQGVYACTAPPGQENWLALAINTDEQWDAFCEVIGRPRWTQTVPLHHADERRIAHELIDKEIAAWCAGRDVEELVATLVARGIPAARVTEPVKAPNNPQMRARGFVETFDHPIVGRHEVLGLPFRFASNPRPWYRTPSPTIGQHNKEVLQGILGMSDEQLEELESIAIIGVEPKQR